MKSIPLQPTGAKTKKHLTRKWKFTKGRTAGASIHEERSSSPDNSQANAELAIAMAVAVAQNGTLVNGKD